MTMKESKFLPLIGFAFSLAVGCTNLPSVGPNYEEPEFDDPKLPLPDAGKVSEDEVDTRVAISKDSCARWWTRFDDPVLVDLIESAQTNNHAYQVTLRRLRQAEWEEFGSYAAFLPQFAVGGAWKRNWYEQHSSASGMKSSYNVQNVALDGNWEIDLFGGNRRRTEAAIARAEAMRWTADDAWVALTTRIGVDYIQLRTTQARIAVAETNLVLQTETYDILKSRLDSGIGDELAVNQCAYIVETTRANIPQLRAEEERLKNELAILAGKVPGELEEALAALPEPKTWLLESQKIAELPLDWMRGRPDVKAAERALAAQTAMIGVAKAQWFPKLYVTGQIGFQNTNGTRLFSRDSFFAALGPAASWPIFQGGAIYANVKAAEEATEAALLEYEHAIESAYGDVRNAYASYTQEQHRYESLGEAVKAASSAVEISRDLYRNGLKDFNNVLDAQRSRLQLEEAYVLSRGQITLNLISLYKALGGGLAADEVK